jgi:glucose-1-phosphate thymidylyltransferase
LFFGPSINDIIRSALNSNKGATIFGYEVKDPNRFGVIEFDNNQNVISIEEKPLKPKSNWAATGLYIYNSEASKRTKNLKSSNRGELEITDLNNTYLVKNELKVVLLDENYSWLDTGTHNSLLEASNFVKNIKDEFGEDSIGLV